ncbi:unnamed protein product [Blepharisma stoltei]|uniref:F5/8 type C domain-containing protein n=1 Tax=Blepharisma stoltei TaxID=1481888 RepID=A0AAU9JKZ6_9CILI|nr:unnamed protein product [Blepharisma stoltei]
MEFEDESGVLLNYLTYENGAKIIDCSSYSHGCHPSNVLNSKDNKLWLSREGMPQSFTVDFSTLIQKPSSFQCLGVFCWHAYNSNPAIIDLFVSQNNDDYTKWATLQMEFRAGAQYFPINQLSASYNYLKLVVIETYGASRTYLNQIYFFEEIPKVKKQILTENPFLSSISTPDRGYDFSAATCTPEPLLIPEQKPIPFQPQNLDRKLKEQLCELTETMKSLQIEYLSTNKPMIFEEEPPQKPQEDIKKENDMLATTVDTMRSQISSLASHVDSLQRNMLSSDYNFIISRIKEDILYELQSRRDSRPESRNSYRSQSPEEFASQFENHIKKWENRVLTPILMKMSKKNEIKQQEIQKEIQKEIQQEAENPGEILEKLQAKISEKAEKMRVLQETRSRRRDRPHRSIGS